MKRLGWGFWGRQGHRQRKGARGWSEERCTLDHVRPGEQVCLEKFAPGISQQRMARLRAYGLVPGCRVRVLQVWPVVVVQVEHTELALENELARQILIDRYQGGV